MRCHLLRRSLYGLLTLTLIATSAAEISAGEVYDLILVAGQSNAVGYDAKPTLLPADPLDEKVMFWWKCGDPPPDDHDSTSGGKWTHLQAQPLGNPDKEKKIARQYGNFAQKEGGFGPEIGLGRALQANEGKKLAIVKAAFSGTSLGGDWNHSDSGPGGACYRALVAETQAAIAAAKEKEITFRLRALVWVQGESDANTNAAPPYTKRLGDMIVALRKDLDAPELLALVAVNTRFGGGKNPFMPQIVEAQKALAEVDPLCVYVDTASATIANGAHFDTVGTLDIGRRFATALGQLEAKLKSASGK